MSAAARLGGFALVLALLFATGLILGHVVGPL